MIKYLLISILILFTSVVKSSTAGEYALGYIVAGFASVPLFDRYWHFYQHTEDGLYICPGVDPKHALKGNLDLTTKVFYRINRLEPFLAYETFPDIKYQGLSVGANYAIINKKLSLLSGLETTRIWNTNGDKLYKVIGVGWNTEIRYFINDRFSVSYNVGLDLRPEISKPVVYSGTILINFKIL